MNTKEILDQLAKLTAIVKEQHNKEEDLTEEEFINCKPEYILQAKKGGDYCANVSTLCHIEDTGNGFIAFFPSYNSIQQSNYICMEYSEADYLRKLLNKIHEAEQNEY